MITTVEMPISRALQRALRLPWRYRVAFWAEDRWRRIRWGRKRYRAYVQIREEVMADINRSMLGA